MKAKRIFALVLAAVLVLSLLTGCGEFVKERDQQLYSKRHVLLVHMLYITH